MPAVGEAATFAHRAFSFATPFASVVSSSRFSSMQLSSSTDRPTVCSDAGLPHSSNALSVSGGSGLPGAIGSVCAGSS